MDPDAALLEAWRAGDGRAGETLFRRRVGEITRFFRNKVADDHDVADLVSQTFLGLTQSRDRFRGESTFRSFAFRTAHNVLRGYIRTRYKRAREELDFSAVCMGQLAPNTPSSIMMKQRGGQAFVNALRDLSLDDQIILELKCFEALKSREIAEILSLPEGTVRGRLARATARLKDLVAKRLEEGRSVGDGPATVSSDDVESWAAEVRVMLGRDEAT
ncbi:MAG: sigma-70 family RNA polymerase sigma factor [Myxococcota bacterium]